MADRTRDTHDTRYAETAIQKTALAVGIVFLIVGIAGFIPGLTHPIDHLDGAGADSDAMLMGVFQVSVLHNIVHILFGVAGLAVAARARASRNYLIWGGAIYLVLFLYGLFAVNAPDANFVPVNGADNWLHLALGVGMLALGLLVDRNRNRTSATRNAA
ncbi:DUF4383 domain-containing protein [Microbacterium trichothecenolyticum]|uniref:DUF4383 domain-containing protein n=1 Tax=Microbacterium trichothecenolyticum TaxID=69370 RepID=UPI001C6E1AF1|nr:DUF4383 domain-containing protein [Microbacterium trichothecenolyticum]MBW9119313.1 DUF4383 domain-containing protein [Microbacterium trichothecenolyticum]